MSAVGRLFGAIHAQVVAEVTSRLRSTGTLVAMLALLVGSYLWIPDPASNGVSIAWEDPAGGMVSGVYNSAYVGASVAVLASLFLSLIGFYLVAGSVRRDGETGVGAILAATPLSRTAYLTGKWAAHLVYLVAVAAASLAGGLAAFLRHGEGALEPLRFLAPFLLLVLPALAFTAAVALAFDVTPGLRGRGGLVLFFFVWAFGFLVIPAQLHGGMDGRGAAEGLPVFDPVGLATFIQLVKTSVPVGASGVSIGLIYDIQDLQRIVWDGLRFAPALVAARLASLAWSALPLGFAVLLFDRFDPARGRVRKARHAGPWARRLGRQETLAAVNSAVASLAGSVVAFPGVHRGPALGELPAVEVRPGALRAVLAEARLIWLTAGWLRWPLAASALVAGLPLVLPGDGGRLATAAFLLLLAPVVSEAAARESLAGTRGLVFSQPAVPASPVLWKAAATALFVLVLGLPALAAAAAAGPGRVLALLLGLAFIAAFATAAGSLTGGGKLFSGLYVALWYGAVNDVPGLDFTGALSSRPSLLVAAAYLGAGLALAGLAVGVERRRWRMAG